MATPLSDCGNGTRSRRERSRSLKSAELMDEQVADSCSSNVTVLAIPAQFIRCIHAHSRAAERTNAARKCSGSVCRGRNDQDQCVTRMLSAEKRAKWRKCNPHKFRLIYLIIGGGGRNRTGVHGFAGRCMTTLPPRRVGSRIARGLRDGTN